METKTKVFHEEEKKIFVSPPFGPNVYEWVGKEILDNNLALPTGDHTASLLHTLYCSPNPYHTPEFDDIRQMIRDNGLWIFNVNVWTSNGVYVLQDLGAKGNSELLNSNKLEEALKDGKENSYGVRFSAGNTIRFAPVGTYKFGEHTPDSLSRDGFILASFGEEGAKKIGRVSIRFNTPYVLGPKVDKLEQDESEQLVSTVYPRFDNKLCFVSNKFMSKCRGGLAFGWYDKVF